MSDKVVVFGASAGFGVITGCELQSDTPNITKARARALDSKGNEVNHKFHNVKDDFTAVYNIVSDTNDILDLILGALMNSRIVTSIQISTANGDENNKLTIIGHNHEVNAHADTLQQVAISSFLPVGGITAFGVIDFLGGTSGDNASPVSGEITFACQHNDKEDSNGDHFCGENYDGMVAASTNWEGVPTTVVDGSLFDDYTSKENPVSNTEFKTTKADATAALALVIPVVTP